MRPRCQANRSYCFGVGFEISLACDFRIVSETCFYALPEQKLGQIPGSGGMGTCSGEASMKPLMLPPLEKCSHGCAD